MKGTQYQVSTELCRVVGFSLLEIDTLTGSRYSPYLNKSKIKRVVSYFTHKGREMHESACSCHLITKPENIIPLKTGGLYTEVYNGLGLVPAVTDRRYHVHIILWVVHGDGAKIPQPLLKYVSDISMSDDNKGVSAKRDVIYDVITQFC